MNERFKLGKLKHMLIGISTTTSISNKFKILLLNAILALDCRSDNVCYFYLLHQHFFRNKKPGFFSVNNCEKVLRISDRSKGDLFMSSGHQGKRFHRFFQNKKPDFRSVNNCEKALRMSNPSKSDLFMSFEHQGTLFCLFQ